VSTGDGRAPGTSSGDSGPLRFPARFLPQVFLRGPSLFLPCLFNFHSRSNPPIPSPIASQGQGLLLSFPEPAARMNPEPTHPSHPHSPIALPPHSLVHAPSQRPRPLHRHSRRRQWLSHRTARSFPNARSTISGDCGSLSSPFPSGYFIRNTTRCIATC
jgi:hypothetical protein